MSQNSKEFSQRHIGLKDSEINHILHDLGYENMEDFLEKLIPNSIYSKKKLNLPKPLDEPNALRALKEISKKNLNLLWAPSGFETKMIIMLTNI